MKYNEELKDNSEYTLDEIEIIDIDNNSDKDEEKVHRRKSRLRPIAVVCLIILFVAVFSTFSWYKFSTDEHADTGKIEIMTPYFLYLLNAEDHNSLQFSVGNIYPGETKQIVLCVSNQYPKDKIQDGDNMSVTVARNSNFRYDLEFLYTQNIPVKYDIYELEEVTDGTDSTDYLHVDTNIYNDETGTTEVGELVLKKCLTDDDTAQAVPLVKSLDETESRWKTIFGSEEEWNKAVQTNRGKYDLYQKDSNDEDLALQYENGKYSYDYYLLEINWQSSITLNDYTKETDMVYVVVNAKQPKPLEEGVINTP